MQLTKNLKEFFFKVYFMPSYTVWGLQLIYFCMSMKSLKCHMKSSKCQKKFAEVKFALDHI